MATPGVFDGVEAFEYPEEFGWVYFDDIIKSGNRLIHRPSICRRSRFRRATNKDALNQVM